MSQDERRGKPRFDVSWPIWVLDNEQELARGETANVSQTGAFFRSAIPASMEPGMTVSVRIGIVDEDEGVSRTVTGDAHVVRLEPGSEGAGIALHFSEELDAFDAPEQP